MLVAAKITGNSAAKNIKETILKYEQNTNKTRAKQEQNKGEKGAKKRQKKGKKEAKKGQKRGKKGAKKGQKRGKKEAKKGAKKGQKNGTLFVKVRETHCFYKGAFFPVTIPAWQSGGGYMEVLKKQHFFIATRMGLKIRYLTETNEAYPRTGQS